MTELTGFQQNMLKLLPDQELRMEEPLSRHTSLHIGGPAEVMAFPHSPEALKCVFQAAALLDVTPAILGAGTNVLAPDEGVRGLVVCLRDGTGHMERTDDIHIRVSAGVTMTRAAVFAAKCGLGGLEFAHGIPGTVGGGVYMNAGAYGGEISDVCETVGLMDMTGNVESRQGKDMDFAYRHSMLQQEKKIVTGVLLRLTPADPEDIRANMNRLLNKRAASQPLDLPSAGSAFKRPVGGYAAALIERAGLKGFRVGNAAISEKHAGFAVNLGGATAADMKALLSEVSERVYASSGIRLEPEIRIW